MRKFGYVCVHISSDAITSICKAIVVYEEEEETGILMDFCCIQIGLYCGFCTLSPNYERERLKVMVEFVKLVHCEIRDLILTTS